VHPIKASSKLTSIDHALTTTKQLESPLIVQIPARLGKKILLARTNST